MHNRIADNIGPVRITRWKYDGGNANVGEDLQ